MATKAPMSGIPVRKAIAAGKKTGVAPVTPASKFATAMKSPGGKKPTLMKKGK